MRLSSGVIGLVWLGCDSAPAPAPGPEAPAAPAVTAASQTQPTLVPQGMVAIAAGLVVLGPRHLPPVDGASLPPMSHPPPQSKMGGAPPPTKGGSVAWSSAGGRGFVPMHVQVSRFWIDRTEVTRAAYAQFLDATGYRLPHVGESWADDGWNWTNAQPPAETEDHPVVLVSWYDADAYCRWADKRLPTEAEWQLAALGPANARRDYPWGNVYDGRRLNHGRIEPPNFDGSDGHERTAPVGSYPGGRAASGIEDAFGNAWEFTADLRVEAASQVVNKGKEGGVVRDASAPGPGLRVAVRGGSFYFDLRPNPGSEWSAFVPELRRKSAGFRCARDGG